MNNYRNGIYQSLTFFTLLIFSAFQSANATLIDFIFEGGEITGETTFTGTVTFDTNDLTAAADGSLHGSGARLFDMNFVFNGVDFDMGVAPYLGELHIGDEYGFSFGLEMWPREIHPAWQNPVDPDSNIILDQSDLRWEGSLYNARPIRLDPAAGGDLLGPLWDDGIVFGTYEHTTGYRGESWGVHKTYLYDDNTVLDLSGGVGYWILTKVAFQESAKVPEPASLALLALGLIGVAFTRRKKVYIRALA